MIQHKNMTKSDAICAKTARACDYCIRRRARWYCAADDAFLCQACDSSVHSANPLARRHERVRLNTASLKCSSEEKACIPSWHRGVQRKARTPRHGKQQFKPDVPELGRSSTTTSNDESDPMQVLYRVPILDPFVSELCSPSVTSNELTTERESKYTEMILLGDDNQNDKCNESLFNLDLDMDMAEFAADVESLLGKGLDNESYGIEELGLLDCHGRGTIVKDEEDDTVPSGHNMDMIGDPFHPFELSFDYNSPVDVKELEDKSNIIDDNREWRISLRLDYDAITTAWASQGSPWMNGERPLINPNDCWFHGTMGGAGTVRPFGEAGMIAKSADGGREARVSRYREKRRTRLFSKKIRYEVRKLNAEKRPRMKGRFVKRSSLNPILC